MKFGGPLPLALYSVQLPVETVLQPPGYLGLAVALQQEGLARHGEVEIDPADFGWLWPLHRQSVIIIFNCYYTPWEYHYIINKANQNKMLKLMRRLHTMGLQGPLRFQAGSAKNVPSLAHPRPEPKFFSNLYGIKVEQHVLTKRRLQLSDEKYRFYQKISPNYLVALVRKVLNADSPEDPKTLPPLEQFYRVCTYCQVTYLGNNSIELEKLYRVKIEDIKEISSDTATEGPASEAKEEPKADVKQEGKGGEPTENELDGMEETGEGERPNKYRESIRSMLRRPKGSRAKKRLYYHVKVKMLQEPQLEITEQLHIKYAYLLDMWVKSFPHELSHFYNYNINDIMVNLDVIAADSTSLGKKEDVQLYLEANGPEEKIDVLLGLMHKAISINRYLSEIEDETKNTIRSKKFYEYYSEMMKISKQAIDGKKTKELFIEKCSSAFKQMNPSKEVAEVFALEVDKYEHMDENSMEAGIVKNYIEELSRIPFNVQSQEVFDLEFAQKVMDEEHYGMKQVKDAILEVIAIGKLKKTLKGKIFCFIGGPGLGKTSFAKSVARSLNRNFYNISLGGVTDSSVLKGHRRTYVGAYSGKIIEALKACGTNNPVILLDEIDKMGSSYHGDPRSELLEILDPNQNSSFVDNFVDVPVDLSNVLFITSANYERNISKPLLDRMEKIYLSSYTKSEKIEIFNRHLLPRAIEKTGVQPSQFSLSAEVIDSLIEEYSLGEPGVRYLEKHALSLLEKVAYKMMVKEEEVPIQITKENIHGYLGNPFYRRKDHNKLGKGVAISLGGGDYGSRLTYIEAFKKSYISRKEVGRGAMFTGSLGDVFKEAMNISYTYARNYLLEHFQNRFLYENEVHVHAPEGAFKKDGSTDSLTIVAALVSLALSTRVKSGVAMTGEVTLNGQVLRTHSIKEKIMVASREKIREVILPKDNEPDVQDLSKDITENIQFRYIRNFDEAFQCLFPDLIKAPAQAQA